MLRFSTPAENSGRRNYDRPISSWRITYPPEPDQRPRYEEVDPEQPVKLENAAQVTSIPGVDLGHLSPEREAVQKLNAEGCTCGCGLTIAKCRIDDPQCPVSLTRPTIDRSF